MFLNSADLVWRTLAVFPRLVDHSGCQLSGIELAHSKTFQPRLLATREALQLRPPVFHSLMSTRSDPHWQKRTTATEDECIGRANTKQNVAIVGTVEAVSCLKARWPESLK